MTGKTTVESTNELITWLQAQDELYFEDNTQTVSDEAYDSAWLRVKELAQHDEAARRYLMHIGLPVGCRAPGISGMRKSAHTRLMQSLDKVKITDKAGVRRAVGRIAAANHVDKFAIELKYDGLSVAIYKRDNGCKVVTRGNGRVGEDVTDQLLSVSDIRRAVDRMPPGTVVRGEALVNAEYYDSAAALRNIAGGALKSLQDGAFAAAHGVFIGYDLKDSNEYTLSEVDKLLLIESWGFTAAEPIVVSADRVLDEARFILDTTLGGERIARIDKAGMSVAIDGLVVKPMHKPLPGEHADDSHEFGHFAIKPRSAVATAKVADIILADSPSGKITPIAVFDEPIQLNTTRVQRASLGSWANAQKLKIGVGSYVIVELANDVIPRVESVITQGEELVQPNGTYVKGAHLFGPIPLDSRGAIKRIRSACKWAGKGLTSSRIDRALDERPDIASTRDALVYLAGCDDQLVSETFSRIIEYADAIDIACALHIPGLTRHSFTAEHHDANSIAAALRCMSNSELDDLGYVAKNFAALSNEYRTSDDWSARRADDIAAIELFVRS